MKKQAIIKTLLHETDKIVSVLGCKIRKRNTDVAHTGFK